LGSAGNIFLKILVLGGISYFLYEIWRAENPETEADPMPTDSHSPLSNTADAVASPKAFFDMDTIRLSQLLQEQTPYRSYLENQFGIIWDFILPLNGYLLLREPNGKVHVLHKRNKIRFSAAVDFSKSQVFRLIDAKDDFLVENQLAGAAGLLPFYAETEFTPAALFAFGTALPTKEKLYWIFDADSKDFFNEEDIGTLKRINRNSEQMLDNALQHFALLVRYAAEGAKFELAEKLNEALSITHCIEIFTAFMVDQFEASKLTIALKEADAERAVIQKAVGLDDPFKKGYAFALDEGLNGWVIMKNKPYLIDNIDKGEYFVPRFSQEERSNYKIRSFLSVPISFNGKGIGMVTIEDKTENKYNEKDKDRLIVYGSLLSKAIGRFQLITENTFGG